MSENIENKIKVSELLNNIDKIKTTDLGRQRISRNLNLKNGVDPLKFCINIIKNSLYISKKGKNWYVKKDNFIITINASSYTIITAHTIY